MAPAGAGIPVKKLPAQAGLLGSSIITLKRARRSPAQIAKTRAAIQPADLSSCRPQKYKINAEIDEVRQAVELGAKTRRALEHARDPAVNAVEQCRKHDRRKRPIELVL